MEKYLLDHLDEAKQKAFVDVYRTLLVGTGAAGKPRTTLLTVKKSNITTVKDLMEVLDEERQARQIHLVLQTLLIVIYTNIYIYIYNK